MFENKKVIIGGSIILAIILVFTGITFLNNLKLNNELQLIKESAGITSEDGIVKDDVLDKYESNETNEEDKQDREKVLKDTMIENIRKKSDDAITQAVGLERIQGNGVSTLEEATDNMVDILNTSFITFLVGMEAISGYLALVLILIGSIGTALTGKAPFARKGFITLIVLGPVIFIVANYGPALLNFL